jgi:hypothetical protein
MNATIKYKRVMDSLRAKLENPPYLGGNRRSAYREGIRAAMSLIHAEYKPDKGEEETT